MSFSKLLIRSGIAALPGSVGHGHLPGQQTMVADRAAQRALAFELHGSGATASVPMSGQVICTAHADKVANLRAGRVSISEHHWA
jgi:hypothetical protein